MIVLDSSYTLALVMPDEGRPHSIAEVMLDRLLAPSIWPVEIANAMRNGVRRGRVRDIEVAGLCANVGEFEVEVVPPWHDSPQRYFEVAQTHDLTPYDAMYLDLALQRRCALATRDEALAIAARRVGVRIYN
jgi:predicted nucleic acid-binding protein